MNQTRMQLVEEFGRAWERRDIEAIIAALSDDIVYQNVPVPEMRGKDAVRHFITPNLTRASGVQFKFLFMAQTPDGNSILCERMDCFFFGEQEVPIPVMGIFEFRGDKIARWRDYADIATFVRQMRAIGQAPGPGIE